MIKTGLPYDMSEMNTIKDNGAIVDMSNINFPNIDDDIRVSYIYLRNTDFNVELDFSKCSTDFRKKFTYFYLFGDINYNIDLINNTWIKIIALYNNADANVLNDYGILSSSEIDEFIEEYKDKIDLVNKFLFSLMIFPIIRLKEYEFGTDDLEKIKGKPFNENVYGIIRDQFFNDILTLDGIKRPVVFEGYFTEDNNILFETIAKYTPYQALLYGLFNSSDEDWNKFISGLGEPNAVIRDTQE